ncbi:MAG: hypothetical protein GF333_01160 [Candidatus Omnitrophica bacterium]|nr:hypothetical protein [Candidatus Omnitrophota bacterium]
MKKVFTLSLSFLFFLPFALCAETLVLKNGNEVRGKIVEQTGEYVKIEISGVPLTYWKSDIESIEGAGSGEHGEAIDQGEAVSMGESTEYLTLGNKRVKVDVYNPGRPGSPVVLVIHGSAGITGKRASRYRRFGYDLMNQGIIAVNVHYFESSQPMWVRTFVKAIDFAQSIPNADEDKIGMVGYSLGGTVALQVASRDPRIKLLAISAGYFPPGFTKFHASRLPKMYFRSGSKDNSIKTLRRLKSWYEEYGKSFTYEVDKGYGHTIPMTMFWDNWRSIVMWFADNFGVSTWPGERISDRAF